METSVVAIGALGGSGTRVVAEILARSGYHIGDDLNTANDNLLFTKLFKNPRWLKTASKEEVFSRLKIFEKYSNGDRLDFDELKVVLSCTKYHEIHQTPWSFYPKFILRNIYRKKNNLWGWKEPNNQIYLNYLYEYFGDNIKYIHVLRHGLDMAFSSNLQQVNNWGYRLNVDQTQEQSVQQLEYWVKSTTEVFRIRDTYPQHKFYLLNHDNLCSNPKLEVSRLLNFLCVDLNRDQIQKLTELPKKPNSQGRYKKYNLSIFPQEYINKVKEFGFEI